MRTASLIFFTCLIMGLADCKKKQPPTTVVDSPVETPTADTSPFRCTSLPPTPLPLGWSDSTAGPDREINTYLFNPANPNEIIIVVNGDLFGYNKMFCYNVPTGALTYLATLDDYPPSVNKKGWVVFSTVDRNVFKVKCNGDSATQMTNGNITMAPQWDYTGDSFYYFQMATGSISNQVIRSTSRGQITLNIPGFLPETAPFSKSDKFIYQKTSDNTVQLFIHDSKSQLETAVITATFSPSDIAHYFNHVVVDNNDEYIYWTNSIGLLRCSFATHKVDTMYKNCDMITYLNPRFQTTHPEEILFCAHTIRVIQPNFLFHDYRPVLMNLNTRQYQLLNIYP